MGAFEVSQRTQASSHGAAQAAAPTKVLDSMAVIAAIQASDVVPLISLKRPVQLPLNIEQVQAFRRRSEQVDTVLQEYVLLPLLL